MTMEPVTVLADTDEFQDRLETWIDTFRDRLQAHFGMLVDEMPDLAVQVDQGEWSHARLEEWAKEQALLFLDSESA